MFAALLKVVLKFHLVAERILKGIAQLLELAFLSIS
jgi:hypothetical protein